MYSMIVGQKGVTSQKNHEFLITSLNAMHKKLIPSFKSSNILHTWKQD